MDPHSKRVYAWEDSWPQWNYNSLTLASCRTLIAVACKQYRLLAPRVIQHNKRTLSWCEPVKDRISLQGVGPNNRGGKNAAVCLHEAAHHIAWKYFGDRIADHGPTWLGIYMWLLESAEVAPAVALHASARKFGLRWRRLPPSALRLSSAS
jgi:hypothetical protein